MPTSLIDGDEESMTKVVMFKEGGQDSFMVMVMRYVFVFVIFQRWLWNDKIEE